MKTGHQPAPPRCTLARLIQEPMDRDAVKRQGWLEQGILVISETDPDLSPTERAAVRSIGNNKFGRRDGDR